MRIFFVGTVLFSYKTLEKLIQMGENIVGVAAKEASTFNADFVSLDDLCEKNNIPFKYVKNINDERTLDWIEGLDPDIIFCFGWSNLLKAQLLKLPALGVVGFHPAKLPANRGRHPIIWALVLGLRETGSTFFTWMRVLTPVTLFLRSWYLSKKMIQPPIFTIKSLKLHWGNWKNLFQNYSNIVGLRKSMTKQIIGEKDQRRMEKLIFG